MALLVTKDYHSVDEISLFSSKLLGAASRKGGLAGLATYQKAIGVHLWQIRQQNCRANHRKDAWIRKAQISFLLFLAGLVFVYIFVALKVIL